MKISVSIIIPVYNGENYLRDAIDSALAQKHINFEVIVINDGSTDATEKICFSYGNRIRYICKENGGVSSALNLGVHEMRGEYFTWLAHDDMFYPYKLALQMDRILCAEDKTMIVHGNFDLLNVKDNTVSHIRQDNNYRIGQLTNSVFPLLMTTLHASTPLIHKSHFERVGIFDESLFLTQDYNFLFRAMRGKTSHFISEPLLISRLHNRSGKNTDNRFGKACAKQYKYFIETLTYSEVCDMFSSPKAFYLRLIAMMKARYDMSDTTEMIRKVKLLPNETRNMRLNEYIYKISNDKNKKICIFGAGYYGKILKFELEYRGIEVACFCDNNQELQGKIINGILCVLPSDILKQANDFVFIIAADISDVIEKQLVDLGVKHFITKKRLDSLILETPPII